MDSQFWIDFVNESGFVYLMVFLLVIACLFASTFWSNYTNWNINRQERAKQRRNRGGNA